MWVPVAGLLVAFVVAAPAAAQQNSSTALAEALTSAVRPALPFPDARDDGTAPGGDTASVWTVRWPANGQPRVEVLANPLNPDNHERALKAEEEIQKAAMRSQRQSQADYEKALSDFQRTGRVGGIREISLGDDGVAGERYDAESQLTLHARAFDEDHTFSLATSKMPESLPASGGPAAVVRVAANTYQEAGGSEPAATHFCPEEAWVVFGAIAQPVVERTSETLAGVSVRRRPEARGSRVVIISIRGNVELVDRVLRQADWSAFRSRLGG